MVLNEAYDAIEKALIVIGVEPEHARNSGEGQWSIFRDEIEIFIDTWHTEGDQWNFYFKEKAVPVFQVIAPIAQLPDIDRNELATELMHLNFHLFECAFMINVQENLLAIKYRSAAENLSVEEVLRAVESVSYYAAYFAPRLMSKYQLSPL
jgi:hypothetical protein